MQPTRAIPGRDIAARSSARATGLFWPGLTQASRYGTAAIGPSARWAAKRLSSEATIMSLRWPALTEMAGKRGRYPCI